MHSFAVRKEIIMLELLQSLWNLVWGVVLSVWDLAWVLLDGVWDLLMVLHNDMPRLEGLAVGVGLAWVMMRRDKHPLLRALSAPLKLVLDVLDLAWDQVVEVVSDVWETGVSWVKSAVGVPVGWARSGWGWALGSLRSLRDRLSSKE